MNKRTFLTLMGGTTPYYKNLIKIFGSSIVAYWPLWESSGTSATEIVNSSQNGAYAGTYVLSSTLAPSKKNAPLFSDASVNLYTATLQANFPFKSGSMGLWFRVADSGVWTDSVGRYVLQFYTDAQNRVYFRRSTTDYRMDVYYEAADVNKTVPLLNLETTNWQRLWISWDYSAGEMKTYLNGTQTGSTQTSIGEWQGITLNATANLIANSTVGGLSPWSGYVSDVVLLNRPITETEVLNDYNLSLYDRKTLTVLGDSISNNTTEWPYLLIINYNNNAVTLNNYADAGHSIIANMDAQIVSAASNNADIIIIELGTNDDNAGNMTTLQAECEENIIELKASNPRATLYWMNVLPRWTDVGGLTEVDKSNIRTAIAAACTAQGITCWDTYTDPWIVVADTSDGLHPTAAGHAKIAAQVLARLP